MSNIGHNTDREQFEEQTFLNSYRQIKGDDPFADEAA